MYGNTVYGITQYSDDSQNSEQTQIYTPSLIKYFPPQYLSVEIMNVVLNAIANEIGKINYERDDIRQQRFVDTATWGLNIWESNLNIETDLNKSYEDRREVIKAKLRGSGTVTKAMMKNVAEAFSGGEVDIIENYSDYSFIVQFIGIKGIPKNMQGLIDMIEDIKPAHLGYSFKYTYTVWNFIEQNNIWNSFNQKTWNDLKVYE